MINKTNIQYKINVSLIIFILLLLYNGISKLWSLAQSLTKGTSKVEILLVIV